jgi:hypothetical protein
MQALALPEISSEQLLARLRAPPLPPSSHDAGRKRPQTRGRGPRAIQSQMAALDMLSKTLACEPEVAMHAGT